VVVAGVWTGVTGGTGTGQPAAFAGVGMAALAAVARTFDPDGIMNRGVLLP
jgi:FAD/FMN-containing dehydrogenase